MLGRRFPNAVLTRDVRCLDEVMDAISPASELLTAGFPCTDLSQAGLAQGFAGGRSSLVRDVLELLRQRPFGHVLLENVPNWRLLHGGRYLREVVGDVEALGYRWAYRTVDAHAFGIPQRRLRILFYASLVDDPRDVLFPGDCAVPKQSFDIDERAHGFYWTEGLRGLGWGEDCVPTLKGGSTVGVPSPPAILLPSLLVPAATTTTGIHRLVTPAIEDAERLQGLPPGWTDITTCTCDGGPYRSRRRWVLVGNAVNVGVADWLGRRLAQPTRWSEEHQTPLKADQPWPLAAWGDGSSRWAVQVGTWPEDRMAEPLADFLRGPGNALSLRAAEGFLGRLRIGTLKSRPSLVAALEEHIRQMSRHVVHDRCGFDARCVAA